MFQSHSTPNLLTAVDPERFPIVKYMPKPAFENAEYRVRITHTVHTDKRIMSFVNVLWGFEVTGGFDQWEPLTVISVRRGGYAYRAGLLVNDRIVRINNTFAGTLTLREAQLLMRRSGKKLKLYVQGNDVAYGDDEFTVDFWFKLPRKILEVEDQWNDCFPWNDRKKRRYRESNCFQVYSKAEYRIVQSMNEPVVIIEPLDNAVEDAIAPPRSPSRSPSRARTPLIPVVDEANGVTRRTLTPGRDGLTPGRSVTPNRSGSPNRTIHKFYLLK